MKLFHCLAPFALALVANVASAQVPAPSVAASTPRVDARQAKQEQRIEQGQASGALTPRETRRLEREQKGVAAAETRAKADGTVTAQERKRLHHLQNKASKDIHHQKHDAQAVAPAASK